MFIPRARFGGLIPNRRQYTVSVFSVWTLFPSLSNVLTITKWTECGRNVLVYQNRKTRVLLGIQCSGNICLIFLNRNRNSQDSSKIMRLSKDQSALIFAQAHYFGTHAVADNPIWRRAAVRNAGPDKNESRQKFILFKSRRELMRVHES